ncbi:MAG: zinc transporter ZntB [Planctomycetota bacterium]|nr:MAG: zinc transporter ZntB [Planctomycetota bacterium]
MAKRDEDNFRPFDEEGGLVFAVHLPGSPDQFDTPLTWNDLASRELSRPLWIHLDRTRERAQRWLREQSGLNPIVQEALLARDARPRLGEFDDGLLVVLRGVNLNPGAKPDELISIRLWVEPSRIITLRHRRFQTVRDLRIRAQRGTAPETPGGLLSAIALGLALRLGSVVENLQQLIDEAEDALSKEQPQNVNVSLLADVRRQAIRTRRHLAPQRDTLNRLISLGSPLVTGIARHELLEASDQTARVVEDLDEVRDRAAVSQEEFRAQRELQQSRTMYLLTLIAALFLPLGFLTGLLGINVGGIPGQDSPWAFWIVTIALIVLAVVLALVFRKLRWL